MPLEGQVLAGRYELQDELGAGGMAVVYRGVDRLLNRPVAVKVLSSSRAADQAFVARFRREAQHAAKLNHPGIVAVYDTGSDENMHFIVMELVEGRTLAGILAEEGRLPPARAAEIAEGIAAALSFAHENGIVHRDVKPGNVMLAPSGEVKVMDFGIARAEAGGPTLTGSDTVLGTATYLSPEQAESRPVDARSDVYSLGCVLYEMLTGRPPFTGDSAVAVAYKHVREEPEPPTSLAPDIPPALEAIVLRAMAKEPAARYQSAEDMRGDLGRARAGEPLAAAPALDATTTMAAAGAAADATQAMAASDRTSVLEPTGGAPPEEPEKKRRAWAWIVAAAVVVALIVVAVVLAAGGTSDQQGPKKSPSPPISPTAPPSPTFTPSPSPATPSPTLTPSPTQTTPPPSPSPSPSPSPTITLPTPSPSVPATP